MPNYLVEVPEVHYQTVRITADSPQDALAKVRDGDGDYLDGRLEYSHTLNDALDISKVAKDV